MKKSSLIFYFLIIIACVGFFSFFGEGLPRFWYDDISHYEVGSKTPYLSLMLEIADFTQKGFDMRVTNYLISKFYLDFFGEDLYFYRLTKMLAVSFGICMLAYLLIKEGVKKAIILPPFLVFLTSPILMIGTIWIVVLGTWSLFFKVLSFFIFFYLYGDERRDARFYLLSITLAIVILLGVKAREDYTIAPFVMLAFLFVKRQKSLPIYIIVATLIVMVFPYYVFSWSSSGISSRFHIANLKMFNIYLGQVAVFIPFIFYSLYFLATNRIRLNDTIIFSFIWVLFEIGMIFIYPSNEMRYLEPLLLSSIFFFTAVIGAGFNKLPTKSHYIIFFILFLLSGYRVYENVKWDYSFRGSVGSFFVAVDKQMKYINNRFDNSLCLYKNFTLLYYEWKTTNHYVNLNPANSWNRKFEDYYRLHTGNDGKKYVELIKPERFDHIILLDNSLNMQGKGELVLFSGDGDTMFDWMQEKFKFRIYNASLYDTKQEMELTYPAKKAINIVR